MAQSKSSKQPNLPCPWAKGSPDMIAYHDQEWGVPERNDAKLFEFLLLEGAQAGLSWSTILGRRESYRKAYDGFNPIKMARYNEKKINALLQDPGIIRNRLKVHSAVANAKAFLAVQKEFGSFAQFLWAFVGDTPIQNVWPSMDKVPARTTESDAMSKALRKRGFSFVGSTICYAYMQAMGLVNDHLQHCPRHEKLSKPTRSRKKV